MDPTKAMDLARQLAEAHFVETTIAVSFVDASLSATVRTVTPEMTVDVLRDLVQLVDDWKRQQGLAVEISNQPLHVTFS